MIAAWKRQAIDRLAQIFTGASEVAQTSDEAEIDKLHSKIGQLVVVLLCATAGGRRDAGANAAGFAYRHVRKHETLQNAVKDTVKFLGLERLRCNGQEQAETSSSFLFIIYQYSRSVSATK
jgi:hypothetical protein